MPFATIVAAAACKKERKFITNLCKQKKKSSVSSVLYTASENKEVKKMKIGKKIHMKQKIVCES